MQEALDRIMVGRTTVVIAHRLSTIINADIIAVIQDGKIVESGDHKTLISKEGGAYAALVKLQESSKGVAEDQSLSRQKRCGEGGIVAFCNSFYHFRWLSCILQCSI